MATKVKGTITESKLSQTNPVPKGANLILALGLGGLVMVPVFKNITHLPPFAGMLLVLGLIWLVSERIHRHSNHAERRKFSAAEALTRIDVPGILFFFGILLAISALQVTHILTSVSSALNYSIGNQDVIVIIIGLFSAVVDNVPLVAASMGMYPLALFPTDHKIWEFMAYCAGTGGSILIIGSAAGVAVMGMEQIDFGWYLKKISLAALLGYFAGAFFYLAQYALLHV
jgi:Na+/H+ antiporter NhaD/arsenite permease-like protein